MTIRDSLRMYTYIPFTYFRNVRIETVTETVGAFLEFEHVATVVESVAPPAPRIEYLLTRTDRLQIQ